MCCYWILGSLGKGVKLIAFSSCNDSAFDFNRNSCLFFYMLWVIIANVFLDFSDIDIRFEFIKNLCDNFFNKSLVILFTGVLLFHGNADFHLFYVFHLKFV